MRGDALFTIRGNDYPHQCATIDLMGGNGLVLRDCGHLSEDQFFYVDRDWFQTAKTYGPPF